MIPRQFLQSFPALLASAFLLLPLPPWGGAARAAEITVAAVLAMAKEEVEKAGDEKERIELRWHVAHVIRRTGEEAAFREYVTQSLAAYRARQVDGQNYPPRDEIAKFNFEVTAAARGVFLDGDERQALELLGQCIIKIAGSPCNGSDTFFYPPDEFRQHLLLSWELDADRFDAALRRLKNTGWSPDLYQYILVFDGFTIAAGDHGRTLEIRGLIKRSGLSITACIVDESSILRPQWAKMPAKSQTLGETALLRKQACEGRAEDALEAAQSIKAVRQRVAAFLAIAEGIAGIPYLP